MAIPLYVTIVDDHFVKCRKEGIVNWTNTKHMTIQELNEELQSGKQIELVQYQGDENGTARNPDWFDKLLKGL